MLCNTISQNTSNIKSFHEKYLNKLLEWAAFFTGGGGGWEVSRHNQEKVIIVRET
jgi:hypothetical protein